MGANSLPKTVIRQRRGCDLKFLSPCPPEPESSTLTAPLPSHLTLLLEKKVIAP